MRRRTRRWLRRRWLEYTEISCIFNKKLKLSKIWKEVILGWYSAALLYNILYNAALEVEYLMDICTLLSLRVAKVLCSSKKFLPLFEIINHSVFTFKGFFIKVLYLLLLAIPVENQRWTKTIIFLRLFILHLWSREFLIYSSEICFGHKK